MRHYKAIFLDWDDTIGDFHHAERHALRDIYDKYGLRDIYPQFEDYYNVYHPHNLLLWDKYGRSEVTKKQLQLDRFLYPLKGGIANTATAAEMGDDFLDFTNNYFSLMPYAGEVVRYLAQRYPLTIVSNGFSEVQYKKIQLSGLQDCFLHIVLSEEVGAQKPNPLIYQKALEQNGLNAEDVLMIGDSYNSDIQGAINAGIDQLWITQDNNDTRPATYRVPDIRQIMELL